MENVMEALKSMDIMYIYGIAGIVVLVILCLIWVMFLRKRGPSAEDVKNAEMALSEAKQKEADLYAQDEYQRAEDSLAKATQLLTAKEYGKAKKAVENATEQARQASKAVEENKAKMKAEDERMLGDFNRQVDELKVRAAKLGTDAPTEVPHEVQDLVGKWEIMKMRIPELIQRGRIREAHDELKTIESMLNNVRRQDFIAQPGVDKKESKHSVTS
jgi:F0F1-type ATP synthase membrane subunit b/b'